MCRMAHGREITYEVRWPEANGEMVQYFFEDVDTGATEIVEQYY